MLLCRRVLCPSVVPLSPQWTGRRTVELHDASHFWHSPPNSASMVTSPYQHRTTSSTKESCHRQTGGESQCSRELATTPQYLQPTTTTPAIQKACWNQLTSIVSGSRPQSSMPSAHLVDDTTIRQPDFALPRQQWSLLNRFRAGQGHCGACKKRWQLTDSDLCSCSETQMMSHIVESCPLTTLLRWTVQLHSAVMAPKCIRNNNDNNITKRGSQ